MFSVPSQPGENRGERLGEFESRSVKARDAVEGFHLLENSHKVCRGFQQAMDARTTCFISFIKLFLLLRKRKTIYEVRTVNSHNSETVKPHCLLLTSFSCFIALRKHSCKPIKMHVLSKLFYKLKNVKYMHLIVPFVV